MAVEPATGARGDNTRAENISTPLITDPARTIRLQFADELRARLASGQAGNPLWEAAGMAELCKTALKEAGLNPNTSILDMTFGDIDSRGFTNDGGQFIAEGLGQVASGPKTSINRSIHTPTIGRSANR